MESQSVLTNFKRVNCLSKCANNLFTYYKVPPTLGYFKIKVSFKQKTTSYISLLVKIKVMCSKDLYRELRVVLYMYMIFVLLNLLSDKF